MTLGFAGGLGGGCAGIGDRCDKLAIVTGSDGWDPCHKLGRGGGLSTLKVCRQKREMVGGGGGGRPEKVKRGWVKLDKNRSGGVTCYLGGIGPKPGFGNYGARLAEVRARKRGRGGGDSVPNESSESQGLAAQGQKVAERQPERENKLVANPDL